MPSHGSASMDISVDMTAEKIPGVRPPYDQRLARILVRPLAGTPLRPNHLTALCLALGIASAVLFGLSTPGWGAGLEHWAALCFMLAIFTDHTDGELARMTGRASHLGHIADYLVGSANYTMMFIGVGIGLSAVLGPWPLALGLCAGLANPVIVAVRMLMERRFGSRSVDHPHGGGFEIEDGIYLIGPITWLGGLKWFLLLYGIGSLGYLGWSVWCYRRLAARAVT